MVFVLTRWCQGRKAREGLTMRFPVAVLILKMSLVCIMGGRSWRDMRSAQMNPARNMGGTAWRTGTVEVREEEEDDLLTSMLMSRNSWTGAHSLV
jgi:hypothetical protein